MEVQNELSALHLLRYGFLRNPHGGVLRRAVVRSLRGSDAVKLITTVLYTDGRLYTIVTETKTVADLHAWVRSLCMVERSWICEASNGYATDGTAVGPWFDDRGISV